MRTFIISSENVAMLRDIQVAFGLVGNMVTIVQIEIHSEFTGYYEHADLVKFSPHALKRLEKICADWLNVNHSFPQEYNNDDNEIA